MECDPDAISDAIGVAPTQTWRIGDIRQERTGTTHLDCGWRLDADHTDAHDVETQITSLVAALWPAHDYLNALSARCEMQFSIVVHCGASAPSVCFSTGLMQRITGPPIRPVAFLVEACTHQRGEPFVVASFR
jgi:hypothetical protein